MEISHDWSNVTGYGYIAVKQYTNNGLKIKKTPWNRIPSLKKPYCGPINPNNSWSPSSKAPVKNKSLNQMNKTCNICNNYTDIGPKNC